MNILVTNDDGIDAPGISLLAKAAAEFGTVTVLAPAVQSSGGAHSVHFHNDFTLKKIKEGVWSMTGSPADCVRAAFNGLFDEKPDLVLSGINDNFNTGCDILYSATIGAAMEATLYGVPAVCLSEALEGDHSATRMFLRPVLGEIIHGHLEPGKVVNVNFPAVPAADCKGVKYGCFPANHPGYNDTYVRKPNADGSETVSIDAVRITAAEPGSDMDAIFNGYISVGVLQNGVALNRTN